MSARIVKYTLVNFIILSQLLLISGCSLSTFAKSSGSEHFEVACGDGTEIIYVSDLGWHTGIVLPRRKITEPLRSIIDNVSPSNFVEIGWGDREFYLSSGYSYWKALKASFLSEGSVLHIAGFDEKPQEFFGSSTLATVRIEADNLETLQQFIYQSVAEKEVQPNLIGKSLYGSGGFIDATGRFSILNTCNSWTAKALSSAGCKMPRNPLRASSVINALKSQIPTPQK